MSNSIDTPGPEMIFAATVHDTGPGRLAVQVRTGGQSFPWR